MRRALAFAGVLVVLPASAVLAADLEDLLNESREASYTAEQVITCSTPDGVQDAVIELEQADGKLHVGAAAAPDVEVAAGSGDWALFKDGSVVTSVNVEETGDVAEPRYVVDEGDPTVYLGREATRYLMTDAGVVRAELIFDAEVGALLRVVTFNADGSVYCERRFLTFDPSAPPATTSETTGPNTPAEAGVESDLPESLAGFERLDVYRDEEGFTFAYYSDGFFSFAVFQVPNALTLDGGKPVTLLGRSYVRSFSPGQVTYTWETRTGGMAIVGDLPPDMHQAVLDELPLPQGPGLFQRLWRTLFG